MYNVIQYLSCVLRSIATNCQLNMWGKEQYYKHFTLLSTPLQTTTIIDILVKKKKTSLTVSIKTGHLCKCTFVNAAFVLVVSGMYLFS